MGGLTSSASVVRAVEFKPAIPLRTPHPCPSPSRRGVPAPKRRPRPQADPAGIVANEGQRSAARRGLVSASIEPGSGADGLSHHPHAPWRSAGGDLKTPGRASFGPCPDPARRLRQFPSSGRRIGARAVHDRRQVQLASSSRRGRSTPRSVPEASRDRVASPAAGAAPTPPNDMPPVGRPSGMGCGGLYGRFRGRG